jgi:molybdate transport system ATP-binding protein
MRLELDVTLERPGFRLAASFQSDGGVTTLFGPSGAGKSSVALILAGLIRPQRGTITLEGETLLDTEAGIRIPSWRRRIGVVFQEGRLFPHLSVRRNLLYGAWFNRAASSRLGPICDLLGIGDLLERRPGSLSGGEQRRVAIGRALLAAPRLLILDEPLAGLDAARKAEILPYLERLRHDVGLPILFISHALDEVVRLTDQLVLMDRGAVMSTGSLMEMMPRLGLISLGAEAGALIETRVVAIDETHRLATLAFPGGKLMVPCDGLGLGAALRVHVRARDVAIAIEPPYRVSMLNVLPARISTLSQPRDGTVDVTLNAGGTQLVARITTLSAERLALEPGLAVHAMIKSVAFERRMDA